MSSPASATQWRVHAVLPCSTANGPGRRFVVWAQGCTLACPGCFNPRTHPRAGGEPRTAEDLAAAALAAKRRFGIEGVTLSGGEPLQQPEPAAVFCAAVKEHGDLGVVILTGYTRREIERDPARSRAVADADMVLAGRYNAGRHLGAGLRGSDNKEYWARTGRYRPADFQAIPDAELILAPDGSVTLTGMPEGPGWPERTLA